MGALYSTVSGLLAVISRAYPRHQQSIPSSSAEHTLVISRAYPRHQQSIPSSSAEHTLVISRAYPRHQQSIPSSSAEHTLDSSLLLSHGSIVVIVAHEHMGISVLPTLTHPPPKSPFNNLPPIAPSITSPQ